MKMPDVLNSILQRDHQHPCFWCPLRSMCSHRLLTENSMHQANTKGNCMAALKKMCFAGEGVLFNPAVGFELLRTAAERGDAEAQAYLGVRLAMGIYPPLPGMQPCAMQQQYSSEADSPSVGLLPC